MHLSETANASPLFSRLRPGETQCIDPSPFAALRVRMTSRMTMYWNRTLAEDCNQTRAAMRRERMISDLPLELRRPTAGNGCVARWAASFWSETIILDEIAVALNQHFPAVVTTGIFQIADHSRQISGVNVFQARLLSDFSCTLQIFGLCVIRIVHLVVFVKRGHVPRDEWRDAGERVGSATQF